MFCLVTIMHGGLINLIYLYCPSFQVSTSLRKVCKILFCCYFKTNKTISLTVISLCIKDYEEFYFQTEQYIRGEDAVSILRKKLVIDCYIQVVMIIKRDKKIWPWDCWNYMMKFSDFSFTKITWLCESQTNKSCC